MNCDIGNIVHFSNNDGILKPLTVLFNVVIGGKLIGSCQFTIENVMLQVELNDGCCNNFLFKPNKVEAVEKSGSQLKNNPNRLGLGE